MKKIILLTILQFSLLMAGSFVMTKDQPLVRESTSTEILETVPPLTDTRNSTPLTRESAISKHLSSGETWIFENKHMDNIADIGLEVTGQKGANQTVIIKNSKFTNIKLPIRILYVDNVIIEGNYFEDMWSAINISAAKNITVRYNKSKLHGVKPGFSNTWWSANFIQLNTCTLDSLSIEYNLVDRSSDVRPNLQENTFSEDYFSIYYSVMTGSNKGQISNNYIMGSEKHNESATGGGITIDQGGTGFVMENNYIYNTGSFLIGIASSKNIQILNNLGFMTQVHDTYIETNAKHVGADNSGPNKNSQLTITQWHAAGTPEVLVENIIITGNRLLAVRADGTDGHQWLDVDRTELTISNSSFLNNKSDGGDGPLQHPTQQEVYEAIVGADEAGMFATHGQGANYFDENRITQ